MARLGPFLVRGLVGLLFLCSAAATHAGPITDEVNFRTLSTQSMWEPGGASSTTIETFLGVEWGSYDSRLSNPQPLEYNLNAVAGGVYDLGWFGTVDTRTGVIVGVKSSGRIGMYAGAELNGGGIDVELPINATVNMPDAITGGASFTVGTSWNTVAAEAKITASAPSFRVYLDGVFDTENEFYGKAVFAGSTVADDSVNLDLNAGRFSVLEFDSSKTDPWEIFGVGVPDVPNFSITQRVPNPAGDTDGIDETPEPPGKVFAKTPELLKTEISFPTDKEGGVIGGNQLGVTGQHDLINQQVNLTGAVEAFLKPAGTPAVLENKIVILPSTSVTPELAMTFTLARLTAGYVSGMQQEFRFVPVPVVELQFDRPVTRVTRTSSFEVVDYYEQWTPFGTVEVPIFGLVERTSYETFELVDGISRVRINLGEEAELLFEEGVGNLVGRKYLMSDSNRLIHDLGITLEGITNLRMGGMNVPGLIDEALIDEEWRTDPYVLSSDTAAFSLGGFNEVEFLTPVTDPGTGGAPVPEPGTLSLMLVCLAGGIAVSRRKRSQKRQVATARIDSLQ